jgi:hypothetical protein
MPARAKPRRMRSGAAFLLPHAGRKEQGNFEHIASQTKSMKIAQFQQKME